MCRLTIQKIRITFYISNVLLNQLLLKYIGHELKKHYCHTKRNIFLTVRANFIFFINRRLSYREDWRHKLMCYRVNIPELVALCSLVLNRTCSITIILLMKLRDYENKKVPWKWFLLWFTWNNRSGIEWDGREGEGYTFMILPERPISTAKPWVIASPSYESLNSSHPIYTHTFHQRRVEILFKWWVHVIMFSLDYIK